MTDLSSAAWVALTLLSSSVICSLACISLRRLDCRFRSSILSIFCDRLDCQLFSCQRNKTTKMTTWHMWTDLMTFDPCTLSLDNYDMTPNPTPYPNPNPICPSSVTALTASSSPVKETRQQRWPHVDWPYDIWPPGQLPPYPTPTPYRNSIHLLWPSWLQLFSCGSNNIQRWPHEDHW